MVCVKMSEIEEAQMDTEVLPDDNNKSEEESNCGDERDKGNAGWADVMDKILRIGTGPRDPLKAKKLRRKSMILLKAKTDFQLAAKRVKKTDDFEVVKESAEGDNTVKEPKKVENEELTYKQMKKKLQEKRLMKLEWEHKIRVKPDVTQRQREKALQRVATKGMVQLFNAIKQRQVTVETKFKEVGGSEVKKEKVLKGLTKQDFLESIKTPSNRLEALNRTPASSQTKSKHLENAAASAASEAKPTWSALRDDFMLGAEMKDWDKKTDSEDEPDDI
ncbi:pre-60S ribosomal particles component [Chamberlinius hualienensis]